MRLVKRVASVVFAGALIASPVAALAGIPQSSVPELDPSMMVAGLALAGGAVALVIERFRNRKK